MKIKEVTIHNWRSIKDVTIHFEDLMIFIGQNNHGKSNILSALLFFFGEISPNDLDYCQCSSELFVEVLFDGLDEQDKTTFKKYVTAENTIKVRKECKKDGGVSYNGYCQIPNDDYLREENSSNYNKRDEARKLPFYDLLPDSGRLTKAYIEDGQKKFIEENKDSLSFDYSLEATQFMGQKSVAKGIFGEVFYIPSVKRAQEELGCGGKAIFGQLYSKVINRITETNERIIDAKAQITSVTDSLNKKKSDGSENTERPSALNDFEESLMEELSNWDTKIDIEIEPPNIEKIFEFSAKVWFDDGFKTDIERKGQGLQRQIIFALIKILSKTLNPEAEQAETEPRKASKSSYFIFEEPELFLHPQAQRELFDSLVQLSESNNQVILCTHSSAFINLDHHKSICITRKPSVEEGTKVFQYGEDLFEDLADRKKFNLSYWINPDRSELFFAKRVILVEGPTDKTIIPYLAKEIDLFRHDISFIDCGGKGSFPLYLKLLNAFKIRYVAIYDKDHQEGKSSAAIATANKASQAIEDLIDNSIGASIVLKNDIEEELQMTEKVGQKAFKALEHVQNDEFSLSVSLRDKIQSIYS